MSNAKRNRSRAESEPSRTHNQDSKSTHKRPRRGSAASVSSILMDCIPSPRNSVLSFRRAQEEEMVITSIRATDVALGLRRLPAGFYATIRHSGQEWRTENRRSSVNIDLVEWTGPIPIPTDLSDIVDVEVYASFEFQPMLGAGEQLRTLTVTVKQLLDRRAGDAPFMFFPKEQDVVSPCSSISLTVERHMSSMSRVLLPHRSSTELPGELEDTTNQGHSALSRYRKRGERRDLELAIAKFERVHIVCPPDHPYRAAALSNLAMAKFVLCQVEGTATSLEIPLNLYQDALRDRPIGHMDRPLTLIQLAAVSFVIYDKSKDEMEGVRCEELLCEALELSSGESHENRVAKVMLRLRAAFREQWDDSDGSSSEEEDSGSDFTDEDPWISSFAWLERYERFGELDDLEQAIAIARNFVRTTSAFDDDYDAELCNLGAALLHRFERLGQLDDLQDAMSTMRDAVQRSPDDHPAKPNYLSNLGNTLVTRFVRLGDLDDIDNAISIHRNAVQLTPDGHPDKPSRLSDIGVCFYTRFERLGELHDLDDAISAHRDAIQFTPDDNPDRPRCLNNLGDCLRGRFSRLGDLQDLDDAISTHRGAVQLTPDSHPNKPGRLSNLGNSLLTRFMRLGELHDLHNAISAHRDAIQLPPDDHPDKPGRLSNLGITLLIRFERLGELQDVDDAISVLRDAVQLTPGGHLDKPSRLSNLGISLLARFERLGELHDLDNAILTHKDNVQLIPDDHAAKPDCLNGLGNCLLTRFERLGELSDLEDAISIHRDAVQLIPDDHPDKLTCLNNLGICLITRFKCLGELRDVEDALSTYSHAASAPFGSIHTRFSASQYWIACASDIRHHSLLHAHSVAVHLFPQLAWIGLSLEHRYSELTEDADVVREAAAAALDAGFPELAVEWLEQGRSIVWGEQFQLRSSYEELASAYPDHARRLQELSAALDHASATREKSLSALSPGSGAVVDREPDSLRQAADRHRALAIERDNLLRDVRRLPDFDGFLRYKKFSQLRASAHAGPVVVLNAAESRCDALIMLANVDHVIHVPLPNLTLQRSIHLQNTLKSLVREQRDGQRVKAEGIEWETLLSPLWKSVVKPVLDALAFSRSGDPSRIFWCPTGPFASLPFHAAGLYGDQYSQLGHKVFDFVVSSYTPSLAILASSPNPSGVPSNNICFLAVRQPATDSQGPLPGVVTELEYIKEAIQNLPSVYIILVEPSVGTVEEVLSLMKDAGWVHFACHGVQDGINSGVCLADGRRLMIRDIIALSRPRGGLAFLSACQTAKGEKHLSDEAIHIAAGMLFAGYGGVIGTMWSISDRLAPDVARGVYRYLFRKGTRPDSLEASYALHEAIGDLRDSDSASFDEWIPFIHVGL